MGDKNLWIKLGLIVLLVGMCVWQLGPEPQEKLKLGIDLKGGHSLTFEIDTSGEATESHTNLAEAVMNILKQRVDPAGQRNLIWRPIGRNRLEIQMPQASAQQVKHRVAFETARDELQATSVREMEIRTALQLPADERQARFNKMSQYQIGDKTYTIESRKEALDALAVVHDDYLKLKSQYEAAKAAAAETQPAEEAAATPTEDLSVIAQQADEALIASNDLVQKVLATNLDANVVTDILALGRRNETRKTELVAIAENNASLKPLVDKLTASYDDWSKKKASLESPEDLIRLLRGAGVLEFRILATRNPSSPDMLDSSNPDYNEDVKKYLDQLESYGPRPRPGDNYAWFQVKEQKGRDWDNGSYVVAEYAGSRYVLAHAKEDMGLLHTQESNWKLTLAMRGTDNLGRPAIDFVLNPAGGVLFGNLTEANIKRPLCIFLDDKAMSSANINSRISQRGQISGEFTMDDISYVVNTLNAGTLVASLKPVPLQQKSIGPSLGESNKSKGRTAVLAALIVTILFMLVYYHHCGAIADIALCMNLVLTLGIMSFLQSTFTLPGIAGLILMLGMAVDSNVLIYERIREELNRGVSVTMAVRLGYEKAFSAIFDSNVTTIITAIILGSLGSEEIKGFGMTLGVGLCTSLFTSLFVTRRYFNIMLPSRLSKEETGQGWRVMGILAASAGVAMALGYALNKSQMDREDSAWIGLGMFLLWILGTAVALLLTMWLSRVMYRMMGHDKQGKLPMMKLMAQPNFNFMNKYRPLWMISVVVIITGALLGSGMKKDELFDIEFLGGTKVEVEMVPGSEIDVDDELTVRLASKTDTADTTTAEGWLRMASAKLADAEVRPAAGNNVEVIVGGDLSAAQLEPCLMTTLEDDIERNGLIPSDQGMLVHLNAEKLEKYLKTEEAKAASITDGLSLVKARVAAAAEYLQGSAAKLGDPDIQMIENEGDETAGKRFEIVTSETNEALVAQAVMAALGDEIVISQAVKATLVTDVNDAPGGAYLIKQNATNLSDVIGGDSKAELVDTNANVDFKGGMVAVYTDMTPAVTAKKLTERLRQMRNQPDFEDALGRDIKVVGLEAAGGADPTVEDALLTKAAILVSDRAEPWWDTSEQDWRERIASREIELANTTLAQAGTLERVTQFEAQIADEATQKAMIAIILSMVAIAVYLWVRFGSVDFGLSGIIALFHDVAVALGCIMACHYLAGSAIGKLLMLEPFKIDLALIAAFLTIVGYSINDTIVIFDRVRENRGRLGNVSAGLVNRSINETLSRTMITSLTTFAAVFVMYVWGGKGIHGFAFALLVGVITGTYSTIAIATPMILHPRVMWIVAILIMAIGGTAIALTVHVAWLQIALLVIVIALTVFMLRQAWIVTEGQSRANQMG